MKDEYDFSQMKSRPNPYAARLKQQITIPVGEDVVAYFEAIAAETGIPYPNLMGLYLRDCVSQQRQPNFTWSDPESA